MTVPVLVHKQHMPDLTGYMTTEDAAKKLGFHVEHVRRMLRNGALEGLKVGSMWVVSKESVDRHLKEITGKNKFGPRRHDD